MTLHPMNNLTDLRSTAAEAVLAGMNIIREWRESGRDIQAQHTGLRPGDDYTTAVDNAAESAVMEVLQKSCPGTPIFGEMSGGDVSALEVWVIDPMDGTTNFVAGGSFVSVTVALLVNGQVVVGATGCPFTGEIWSAAKGQGTYDTRGNLLTIAVRPTGSEYIALDPVQSGPETLATWNEVVKRLEQASKDVKPLPSIALEMAYVAAGKFDGFVQIGGPTGSPIQDFAAGTILIREAGGIVTGIDGNTNPWESSMVIAGAPAVYTQLKKLLKDTHGLASSDR
jgi:myo-inositol-1(or 4)-monophosphatase